MAVPPRHRWLAELTEIPATTGREHRVVEWVRAWAGRRPELRFQVDPVGNVLLTIKGRKRRDRVVVVAHMDHPGFVVESVDRRAVVARFMGGVLPEYFDGAAVEIFDAADQITLARVEAFDDATATAHLRLSRTVTMVSPGDVGRWRFPARSLGIRAGLLRAHACDDLAGVAACLSALDQARKKPELSHLAVLLTRGEEEGFLGAIGACKAGTIDDRARVLSIETSPEMVDARVGEGPIIRVGDRVSVFDSLLTNDVTQVVRTSGLLHQRKLMSGGACEATAFYAYGHRATGLCLALGNHHNMVDVNGVRAGATSPAVLAPEVISLADYDGLVSLLLVVARHLDDAQATLVERLDSRYERMKIHLV